MHLGLTFGRGRCSRWALFTGLVSTACGTFVSATPLNAPPVRMAPKSPDLVEVYSSAAPREPHVDVALLEADQTDGLNPQGTQIMVRMLRERAGAMGCDAIEIGGASYRAGAPPGSELSLFDPGSHRLSATCIVYVPARRELTLNPDSGTR